MIVSIWCGAARFCHADITRLDSTLTRLFGWGRAAGQKAIVRLFQRFEQASAMRVQMSSYQWLFNKLGLGPVTLNVDSSVLTRWGSQIEGGMKGYNPKHHGRASHHPLLAFVAGWRPGGQLLAAPRQHQRYGAMLTDLGLPAIEVWSLYRGRADCENRIKELKADFGLDSFVLRDFWANAGEAVILKTV